MTESTIFNYKSGVVVFLSLAIMACNGNGHAQNSDDDINSEQDHGPRNQSAAGRQMTSEQQLVYARTELAERLSVDPETVQPVSAKSVTWRSGALGCPEPGMNYTQALVPGRLIELKFGAIVYRYHARFGEKPFYCPDLRAESPVPGSGPD